MTLHKLHLESSKKWVRFINSIKPKSPSITMKSITKNYIVSWVTCFSLSKNTSPTMIFLNAWSITSKTCPSSNNSQHKNSKQTNSSNPTNKKATKFISKATMNSPIFSGSITSKLIMLCILIFSGTSLRSLWAKSSTLIALSTNRANQRSKEFLTLIISSMWLLRTLMICLWSFLILNFY